MGMLLLGGLSAAAAAQASTSSAAASGTTTAATITAERHLTDRTIELTISTPDLPSGQTVAEVMLPTTYGSDTTRRYPVTYFLAGTLNDQTTFRALLDGEHLTEDYQSIVVSPLGDSGYWSDWFNAGAYGPPRYETFVVDTLLPLIDQHFRTLPGRAHRVILGGSMGGYGVMMIAAHHPDLFAAAASISGAVDSNLTANAQVITASSSLQGAAPDAINGPRATQAIIWHGRNPTDLADNLRGPDLQVLTGNGVLDPAIESPTEAYSCVVEAAVAMASHDLDAALTAAGIPHRFKDYGSGCHTPENFEREITEALTHFKAVLADPPAAVTTFNYRSIDHEFSIHDWHVTTDPARPVEFLQLTAVSAKGLTVAGSGQTVITTPPLFQGRTAVDVAGATTPTVQPDRNGRLTFTVDLGPVNAQQQYVPGAQTLIRTRAVAFSAVQHSPPVSPTPPGGGGRTDAPRPQAGSGALAATGGSVPLAAVGLVNLLVAAVLRRRQVASTSR